MDEIKIDKIEDVEVKFEKVSDNTLKVADILMDDFGNEVIMYRREVVNVDNIDAEIADYQKRIAELEAKKKAIN
jgi:hypothetical protein